MAAAGSGGQNPLEDIISAIFSGNGSDNATEHIAKLIAVILTPDHSAPLVPFVERLWPRVDPYIWLYMLYTVLIVGSGCLGISIIFSFARRVYLAVPPIGEWGSTMWAAIKEMQDDDKLRGFVDG